VIHTHDFDTALLGFVMKILKGKKWIYDVHEHWPSVITYRFKIKNNILSRIVEHFFYIIEKILVNYADNIIAVSKSVGMRFKEVIIIPNVPLKNILTKLKTDNYRDCDIVLMGAGLQSYHSINEILVALSKIKREYPKIKLKIIGNVKINIKPILEKYNLKENVILTGFLPFEEMYKEIKKGKIGLVILKAECYNEFIGLPNKLFDYMICELAVIGSNYPEISKIIKTAKCGILVDPNNVDEIVNAILYLIETPNEIIKMGIRGRKFIERNMNWELKEKKILDLYKKLEK